MSVLIEVNKILQALNVLYRSLLRSLQGSFCVLMHGEGNS